MNLLQLLLGTLTSQSSVKTVSKKTGANSNLTSKLLLVAIPLLIRYLTSNAKKQGGAQSLLNALGQHTNTNTMTQQLETADENDGAKIIQHILGKDQTKVVNSLASETGMTNNQVSQTLNTIAPALLSGLSAATSSANNKKSSGVDLSDGIDMSDLVGLFGGAGGSAASGLLGSLLGGSTQQSGGLGDVLGGLLGGSTQTTTKKSSSNTGADLSGLLGALLGGQTQTSTKKSNSQLDGTDLLQLLTALNK